MTSREDFTDEEWNRLVRAPLLVSSAVSMAEPGGPFDAVKETTAALRTILDAGRSGDRGPFVQAVANAISERVLRRENPIGDFRPDPARGADAILDELRAVNDLLEAKATPEEADAFRDWLKAAAQATALAAKEGGFLGIGGQRVTENEQQMLERLGAVFGQPT
jgi:hypothetical protein